MCIEGRRGRRETARKLVMLQEIEYSTGHSVLYDWFLDITVGQMMNTPFSKNI